VDQGEGLVHRVSHVSHRDTEKGCEMCGVCVESWSKLSIVRGLEEAGPAQGTGVPQFPPGRIEL